MDKIMKLKFFIASYTWAAIFFMGFIKIVNAEFTVIEPTSSVIGERDNLKVIQTGEKGDKDAQIQQLRLENIALRSELTRLQQYQTAGFNVVKKADNTAKKKKSGLITYPAKNSKVTISSLELKALVTKSKTAKRIIITGFTDSSGSKEVNLKMGKLRAQDLKNRLVSAGINATKIETRAIHNNYVSSNKTAAGRAKNRRVTVHLLY